MRKSTTGRSSTSLVFITVVLMAPSGPILGAEPDTRSKIQSESVDSTAESPVRITWGDLVGLVDAHPLVAAGDHTRSASLAAVDAAGAAPNPELEATAAYGQAVDKSDARFEWGLALSMPLDWIARRGGRMDAARSDVAVAEAAAEVLRREVILKLRALFWALIEAQERVVALEEMSGQTETLLKTVKRRVELGEVRPVEAVRITVESDKLRGDLEVAKTTLNGRRAQLATWLDGDRGRTVVAVAELDALPASLSVDHAVAAVSRDHPLMTAEEARVRSLAADIDVERRERMPSLSAQIFTDHELDRRAYGGGLSIDLPLWNWNKGAIRRSESLLAAGKKRVEAARLELKGAAIEAQSRCQAGVVLATQYRNDILPNATTAAQTIEKTYALGEATLLDVIDARRTLVETKNAFLDALVKAQTDCSRLRVMIGKE